MRDIARWIRRSPVVTLAIVSGHALGSTLGDVAPHARPFREARLADNLVSAERHKDEFLATLVHELRNPVGVIRNAVGRLQRERGVTLAGQRARALMRLQRERIDLRTVVRNAVETLEPEVTERRQHLTVALPQSPVWLQADPWRLEQVFASLLANSSRYADAEGELAVYMHVRNDQVVVRFRDSGVGIAACALPHVFDLSTRADVAVPRPQAGRGIGLALVRRLVALHGGRVTVASAGLGHGSEFTVRLPQDAGSRGDA